MIKHFTLAALAIGAGLSPLRAEPAAVVTLASVGNRVRAQNPDLAAARMRIEEAVGRMRQAGRMANPELEIGLQHDRRFREGAVEIGIAQKFPVTNRLQLEKEISLTELKAAEAEVREVERQLMSQARQAVVKILAARERRELLGKQSAISTEFAGFLTEVAAKGEGSPLDAGQAKLEAASLALELRQLDAADAGLAGELKPLLGMRPGEPLHIGGSLPEPALPNSGIDPSRRPDFQAAKLDAQAAAQGVALENARRYDDIEGAVFTGIERAEDAPDGYANEAIVGVRVKIPLPLWNKNEGAIHEAQAKQQRKELEARALARGIRLEAETARAEMEQWARMIREINDTLLPLAAEQSELTESAYRNAQGEIQAVLRARETRLELAIARLDALREFHLARIRHQAALGTP